MFLYQSDQLQNHSKPSMERPDCISSVAKQRIQAFQPAHHKSQMWSAQDLQSAPNQSSHATVCAMSTKATSPAAIQCFSGAKVLLWIGHAPSCFKTAMCAAVPYPLCCAKLYCGHRSWYWSISLSRVTYTCTHTFGHCSYTPDPEPSSASACISALLD